MIPYKDLCAAIDRYRARVGAESDAGAKGRVNTLRGNGTDRSGGDNGEAAYRSLSDEGTSAMPVTTFPEVGGARVQVFRPPTDDGEMTSVGEKPGGLSTETNEIDLGSADVVDDDDDSRHR